MHPSYSGQLAKLGAVITVRPVSLDDADVLLDWRNDPATRAASLSTESVARPAHIAWLTSVIDDPRRVLYIGELDGAAIGTVRFDIESEAGAEVSLTVAPCHRGKRLAGPLLDAGLSRFGTATPQDHHIIARVRVENAASRALFTSAGFAEIDHADGVLTYKRPTHPIRTEAPS